VAIGVAAAWLALRVIRPRIGRPREPGHTERQA
jgi:hypothetical protein